MRRNPSNQLLFYAGGLRRKKSVYSTLHLYYFLGQVMSGIQLIVGLGNPGAVYEHTRHNAGVWLIQKIAESVNGTWRKAPAFSGLHSTVRLHNQDCHLLIPTTFMNNSGQSVRAVADYYKIPYESILVLHDEIDLPAGTVRLKWEGGHGGHNGLRDIIQHLGTRAFHRLRIGVGHPGQQVVDYVLQAPTKVERQQIDSALKEAEHVLPWIMAGYYQKAMNELHSE